MDLKKWDYEKYLIKLEKLVELHGEIKNIDKSLSKLYPVAIVENDNFIIFDFDEKLNKYVFIKSCPTPMPMPEKVKAAFDLQEYENKMAAVLSKDSFDTLEGYVFAFHEFVHCYQADFEFKLKKELSVYQEAMKKKDYMWEINHPFPYENEVFIGKTEELGTYLSEKDDESINDYYMDMKNNLKTFDFEYMIWQQWREGYARYIENKIRENVGLEKNSQEIAQPFSRVSFYEIGSRYIDFILTNEAELRDSIEGLFHRMLKL